MIKNNWRKILISCLLTLSPIIFGLIVWDKLPETMPTHWGIDGNADDMSSRTAAVFTLPLILLVLNFICIITSNFDKRNKGTKVQNISYFLVPCISIFTSAIMYSSAFDKSWEFVALIPVFLGVLFTVMGNLMPKVRRNSTMGFKYKWTLQSEENWNATHRFGGKVMVIAGLLIILTAFFPIIPMFITAMTILLTAIIITAVYSYLYYKKEVKNGKTDFEFINPKAHKIGKIIALIVVPVILIGVAIVMFTGSITVKYNEKNFTVDSTYYEELTVDYDSIDSIETKKDVSIGVKTFGFNSAKLSLGKFKNDEFGNHTRYTYNSCDTVVVIKNGDKILVINGKTEKETMDICFKIQSKILYTEHS